MYSLVDHLRDPVYLCRPSQIFRRIWYAVCGVSEHEDTQLAWGGKLSVYGNEKNGRTILHRGIKELTVTESCFRLSRAGTLAVDVGANVGHMTSALAHGMREGSVYAFEPHPKIYPLLERNVDRLSREVQNVDVIPKEKAMGTSSGTETLYIPKRWSENYGLATLQNASGMDTVQVAVGRLDDQIDGPIHLLKLDVEGHEDAVLEGASSLLERRKIRHILFEEHEFGESAVVRRLTDAGYDIYAVRKHLRGPELVAPHSSDGYNFIATLNAEECREQFRARGWISLQNH